MTNPIPPKIAVAMSGGVDSTISAALLQKDHEVQGFFMDLGLADRQKQIKKVQEVAALLSIPLTIVDLTKVFEQEIINYFYRSYGEGITPNPCVRCNPLIKCGHLFEAAKNHGMNKLATGHYAKIEFRDNAWHLLKGSDPGKDQSYFLCGLSQQQLSNLVFPLGEMTKKEVYRVAESLGFNDFSGSESQDICFLGQTPVADFLQQKISSSHGEIITASGKKLGQHKGIYRYTVGQRRGLGICGETPYYVTAISAEKNQVIVGKDKDLWHNELFIRQINWVAPRPLEIPGNLRVKIRYRHQPAAAQLIFSGDWARVLFSEPQRAITPGQFAVIYDGDEVLGGGEIVKSISD